MKINNTGYRILHSPQLRRLAQTMFLLRIQIRTDFQPLREGQLAVDTTTVYALTKRTELMAGGSLSPGINWVLCSPVQFSRATRQLESLSVSTNLANNNIVSDRDPQINWRWWHRLSVPRWLRPWLLMRGSSSQNVLRVSITFSYKLSTQVRLASGFKFIGNTALTLVAEGYEVPFGYEEAIGYMFGPQIRDKDGVAASVSLLPSLPVAHHSHS